MPRPRLGLICILILTSAVCARAQHIISLAGPWRFQLNGPPTADSPHDLPTLNLTDTIQLPGTTESQQKGPLHGPGWNGQLTRIYRFDGAAWYQRAIDIPPSWRGKRITLFLERTKYTQLWLDSKPIGQGTIFCAPQEFDLGTLDPGRHQITIAVDNTRLPLQTEAHQWSDNTQTNWNGIIGRIELQATDPVWIDDLQAYPDAAKHSVLVRVHLGGKLDNDISIRFHTTGPGIPARDDSITFSTGAAAAQINIPLGDTAPTWDEFHPNLFTLTAALQAGNSSDQRTITFGLRDFAAAGPQFTINGRTIFLRGKHNACVFPLTGYPPMDVAGWLRYLRICQQYGINQIRCHTFVPPDAAFTAADQLGMYMQPELPFWGDFDETVKKTLEPDALRILKCYGNHPSFVMFTMGNENRGSRAVIASLIDELRAADPRHLYAQGSNAFLWDPILPPGDDFLISAKAKNSPTAPSLPVRGSFANLDGRDGHVQYGPPNTMLDYSAAIAGIPRPVIGHEVGQYTVYPDFHEIAKYTGVTRAMNLEHFRGRLQSAGMLDQADDFFRASGALAEICYREEIESALRTPKFGGFQLLDLQDFPGQGTALVGMLDAFMDSKGIVTPEKWRQFCAPVVLLARFDKYIWTSAESFQALVQVAHYGEKDLPAAILDWQLNSESGGVLSSGKLPPIDVRQGGLRNLGAITIPLSNISAPARCNLSLSLEGTDIQTSYPVWIYPSSVDLSTPENVTLARSVDRAALAALATGGRVLLIADGFRPLVHSVGGAFATDFWCWPMFHNKPGTMGLLCDPKNPALKYFPTEFHSNWQWFDIALQSQPVVLDDLPAGYRPEVQVIDNMERCDRLGLIFGLRVGPGKLLVCATDLLSMQSNPAARQLLHSLLTYAASDDFNPRASIDPDRLTELLMSHLAMQGKANASSFDPGWQNFKPAQAADGNEYTQWNAADVSLPQWWQFTFDRPQNFNGIEILWGDDKPGYGYAIETSSNGSDWHPLCDESKNSFPTARHRLQLPADHVKAVRVVITALPPGSRAGIREIWFF